MALGDADKTSIITFLNDNHVPEIRNSFYHSDYSLSDGEYRIQNSDPIDGVGYSFDVETYLYPKIKNVLSFFENFRRLYLNAFASYKEDKEIAGLFPNPVKINVLGSKDGLRGFRIKDSVQFFGKLHDSGIMYEEKYDMWAGLNIRFNSKNPEAIEISDDLARYEAKTEITRNDAEFMNLVDKVAERGNPDEMGRAITLLVRFGDNRLDKMRKEKNVFKKKSLPKWILPYYERAMEVGAGLFDLSLIEQRMKELEKETLTVDANGKEGQ
ncbi:MAG: hypothetical protein WDN75_08875 [Bacteroidota bacterium]